MYNIMTYWENINGGSTPPYIELCLESLERICHGTCDVHIITPKNVGSYLHRAGLNSKWEKLTHVSHRADCVRVAIINKMGGLWVDADTYFFKSPISLYKYPNKFLCNRWTDGRILNGYFLSDSQSPLTIEWLKRINMKLMMSSNFLSWTEFGEQILTPLVYTNFREMILEMDRSVFIPINIDKIPHVFFEEADPKGFIKDQTVAVALNHSFFRDNYPQFIDTPKDSVAKGDMLINRIFRMEINNG